MVGTIKSVPLLSVGGGRTNSVTLLSVERLEGVMVGGLEERPRDVDTNGDETVDGKLVVESSNEDGVGSSEGNPVRGAEGDADVIGADGGGVIEGGLRGAEGASVSEIDDGEVILDTPEDGRGTSSGEKLSSGSSSVAVTDEGDEMVGIKVLTPRVLLSSAHSTDFALGVLGILNSDGMSSSSLGTLAVE